MATMEYYNGGRMEPQNCDDNTQSFSDEGIVNNDGSSSLFHNNIRNATRVAVTSQPSEDQHSSVGSGDVDNLQIPSASLDSTGNYTEDGILKFSDDDVDSALLAALRDPRERVSLLRTEQVLIDFMNQPDGYMEIGGPYNSIVLSPTGSITTTNSNKQFNSDYLGGRVSQTSFQRCWLHRLADRFNITRESGCLMEGSIRLVKIRESRIPLKLLVDMSPSEYALPAPTTDNDSSAVLTQQFSTVSFLGNNNNVGSPSFPSQPTAPSNSAPPKTKQPKKMKIMKRSSSSSFGSTGSLNNKSNNGGKGSAAAAAARKGKNFSDKEKAYAEARARIFNENNSSATSGSADPIAAANAAIPETDATPNSNPPTTAASSAATSPITSKSPSAASSSAPSPSSTPPPSTVVAGLEQALENDDVTAAASTTAGARQSQQQGMAPRRPAAASTSGGSKATYRNRRQEESDPDFQRGFRSVPMMPAAYDTAYMYGYTPQQQYYVYPDDSAAAATYYSATTASATSNTPTPSSATSLPINSSNGQFPYASYSQATSYINNTGSSNMPAAASSNATTANAPGGVVENRRGRNSLNTSTSTNSARVYYNPYSNAVASSVRSSDSSSRATSTSQGLPAYEDFPALR